MSIKGDTGPSMMLTVGEFTGGRLFIWNEGKKHTMKEIDEATRIDTRSLIQFDGNKCHATEPFEGWRVSLIWYSLSRTHEATKVEMDNIRGLECEHDHMKTRRDPVAGLSMAVTMLDYKDTNKRRKCNTWRTLRSIPR